MSQTIAVDAMGGDHAPRNIVEGAVEAVRTNTVSVILVGREQEVREELRRLSATDHPRIEVVHASEVVGMEESLALALRQKKDSSIRVAARLVKEGRAAALVSAGNTGAVMAAAKILLGSVKGVDRPAIAVTVPARGGSVVVVDGGANVDCKSHHLRQFAVMGYIYARKVHHLPNPRVGLLSVGEEDSKGTDVTREVFKALQGTKLNFIGNVEGNDLYSGEVDVVVTDGFTGNVALKVSEGLVETFREALGQEIRKRLTTKLGYLLMKPAFDGIKKRLDYAEYGGAPLLGARECVIICHGRSSPKAIRNAVRVAREFVDSGVNGLIEEQIASLTEAETRLAG